jgi:hypothetical protein
MARARHIHFLKISPTRWSAFEVLASCEQTATDRGVRLSCSFTLRPSVCGVEPNAWYAPETRTLTVCSEYVRDVADRASKIRSWTGVTRRGAIFGPVAQGFLHELGHAL